MIAERNYVRVFTSSTFGDMLVEREALINRVFPSLRNISDEHRVVLTNIDLRWGIPDETVDHPRILDIVKSELNRASVMISILGERFGWIPDGEYDSVSALEMYTALASPAIRLLAFQRDTSLTAKFASENHGSLYSTEVEIEQRKLLRRLQHLGVVITPYVSIEQFADEVTKRLNGVLQETYFSKLGNVFISYSRKDIERANDLKELIEGLGFNAWLDLVGIAAGDEWPTKLAEAINECDIVLMLISKASVMSEYWLREIIFAQKKNKPVLGVRLDDAALPDNVEFMIGDSQQIMFSNDGLESVAQKLGEGLRRQLRR